MDPDARLPPDAPDGVQAPTTGDEGEGLNALQAYLRDIRKAPLLSPQEEHATALRARAGEFQARQLMIERHSRYLPVIEDGTLLGVISFLDVAKAVLEEQSLGNRMLKNYIKNWPDEVES